ncbi:hypothetical protein Q8A64_15025 [Oxalobacteraceae bacterium R-40]|uniref:Uncharacterized protein n=1 Tax=Keguizhuia sedimenti TaxID=3064264 RepID=A0ABU1BRT0_9BURK|nr:hypothetical protein [Oxalobacteraceae bacterium R-40]
MPDRFIDLDGKDLKRVFKRSNLFEGKILLTSGYPDVKNYFNWEPIGEFTHSTSVQRHITTGICRFDDGGPFISFEGTEGSQMYEDLNGMSGGVIFDVQEKAVNTKWCGLAVTAGDEIMRFIPADLVLPAILDYEKTEAEVIDPAFERELTLQEQMEIYAQYLRNTYATIK